MGRTTGPSGRAPASGEIATEPADAPIARRARTPDWSEWRGRAAGDLTALALGLGVGLSPLFGGYYSDTLWSVLGLCVVVATGVMVVANRLPAPSGRALVAVGGLVGLGVLALASALWSPSPDGAVVWAGRLLAYAAVVVSALGLSRDRQRRALILGALGLGLTIVAVVTLARMLGPGAPSLFIGGRLSGPLGYAGGTACAFVLGAFLFLGLAVRSSPLEAAAGAFGTVLMGSLAVLTESRSAVPATLLAVVAVLVVQGHGRTIWAILVAGGGVAAAFPVLAHVYASSGSGGHVTPANAHAAALAALGASAGAALLWGAGTEVTARVRARGGAVALRRASRLGLATVALLAIVAAAVAAVPVSRGAKNQWRAFRHLSAVTPAETHGESRLLQGGGALYEYWRVALHTSADKPVAGAGAGSWTKVWFQERHYYDPVWQPNSIVFGTLAELGGIGALLLLAFVGGTAIAMWRTRRGENASRSPSIVAAVGVAAASLSYAATEFTWVALPGVMAIGLLAIGVVLAARGSARRRRAVRRRRQRRVQMAWRGGLLAVLAVAAVLLGRAAIADSLRGTATRSIVANPARAVDKANASLSVNGADVQTYYVKAAALARLGRADEARAALLSALRREPDNFVTWALAGDLDVRRRDFADAQAEYRRAAQLDPLDAGSLAGVPADAQAAAQLVGPRPTNVARRPNVTGYQIVNNTSPLELARALGAPGLRTSDEVVVGLFGYGVG